jgi:hypothetical protein
MKDNPNSSSDSSSDSLGDIPSSNEDLSDDNDSSEEHGIAVGPKSNGSSENDEPSKKTKINDERIETTNHLQSNVIILKFFLKIFLTINYIYLVSKGRSHALLGR